MTILNASDTTAFQCDTGHVHACACCGRRGFLKGLASLGAGALLGATDSFAQAPAPAPAKPFRIDVHHHFSSPGFIAEITGRKTGQVPLMRLTAQKSIEDMDKGGVATSIVSISEPSVFFGNYDAARALARETNDFGARLMAEYPGRFGLFGTVPLPDVDGTLHEIEYVLDTLKADGICMMTDYEGKFLGDPAFMPVMEELNRRKALVFVHPTAAACCMNLIPDVAPGVIEYGTDTTRAILGILCSGQAVRFPDIKFIWSHAGGSAPFFAGRIEGGLPRLKDHKTRLPNGAIHEMNKFYYDVAGAANRGAIVSLMELVAATQVLFGTDYPSGLSRDIIAGLSSIGFGEADMAAVNRGNALRLLPRLAS
jgi:predicted TIM-barrel fold metal-dependent hydrolase